MTEFPETKCLDFASQRRRTSREIICWSVGNARITEYEVVEWVRRSKQMSKMSIKNKNENHNPTADAARTPTTIYRIGQI